MKYYLQFFLTTAWSLVLIAACSATDDSSTYSADRLSTLAARLETGKAGVQSIEVTMEVRSGGQGIMTRARAATSGPAWLLLVDRFDGTPILICSGGRAILYDLRHECVHVFDHASFEALAYYANDRVGIDYRLTNAPSRVLIDVPSLLTVGGDHLSAKRDGDNWLLEGNTQRGGLLIAHVRPEELFPFHGVRMYARGEADPRIAVAPIHVNRPPILPVPDLPNDETLARRFRVVRHAVAAVTPADRRDETAIAIATVAYRVGLHDPVARQRAERETGDQVDWNSVAETDRQISPVLRQLIRPPSTTQPARDGAN